MISKEFKTRNKTLRHNYYPAQRQFFNNGIMGALTYIDEQKMSEITGISTHSLRRDRHLAQGIPYYKVEDRFDTS
jgi:hypothetical protein